MKKKWHKYWEKKNNVYDLKKESCRKDRKMIVAKRMEGEIKDDDCRENFRRSKKWCK